MRRVYLLWDDEVTRRSPGCERKGSLLYTKENAMLFVVCVYNVHNEYANTKQINYK